MAIGVLDRDGDLGASSLLDDGEQPRGASDRRSEAGLPGLGSAAATAVDPADPVERPDLALAPRRAGGAGSRHALPRPSIGDGVAVFALLVLVAEMCSGLLPEEPTIGYFMPLRMVLAIGLVSALLSSATWRSWTTPLDAPIALLVLAGIPPALMSTDGLAPWRWLLTYVAAYYLTVFAVRRVRDLRDWLGAIGMGGVVIASFSALTQAAQQEPTGMCRSLFTGSADCADPETLVRVIGPFSNPNTLGAFLVLFLPFAIGAAVTAKRTAARILGWGVVGVGVLAVFFTFSRGPLLAVIFGAMAYAVLRRPEPARLKRAGLVGAGLAAVLLVVSLVAPGTVGVRWDVWRAAIAVALRNPLGVGLQEGGQAIQDYIGNPDEAYLHAHNLWLNTWLELGWLGLIAALAITALAAMMVLRLAREGSTLAPVLGGSLGGFAVASLVDHSANTVRLALALAFVLGILAAEYGSPRTLKGMFRRPLDARRPAAPEPADTLLDD